MVRKSGIPERHNW